MQYTRDAHIHTYIHTYSTYIHTVHTYIHTVLYGRRGLQCSACTYGIKGHVWLSMECGLTLYGVGVGGWLSGWKRGITAGALDGGVRWRGGRALLMPHLYVHLELVRRIQLLGDGYCISPALEGWR